MRARHKANVLAAALCLLLAGCASGGGSAKAKPAAPARDSRIGRPAALIRGRAITAPSAMVVSNSDLASAAGAEILQDGGNAVDAAVAVGFALAVTHPEAGNIGGGGYMVVRMADGRSAAFDYREVAPAAATRDMYLGPDGVPTQESVVGYRAAAVPGSVAGLAAAEAAFGRLTLARVVAPAIRLARDGFVVDSALHQSLRHAAPVIGRFAGKDRFLPRGAPLPVGSHLVQPELARTLDRIAEHGPSGFYGGPVADAIVAEERLGGGLITHADLGRYRVVRHVPLVSTYRGDTVLTMPPSSSGGVTIVEALNVLATYDSLPPLGSAAYAHILGDVFQRVFVDRNDRLGDPDFVPVPVAQLTDTGYARRVRATIQPARAVPTSALATALAEGSQTTPYSVVDAEGNAVATTTTINDLYGSGVYVRGAGFFLNDEMDDFTVKPGVPNLFGLVQGAQNAIVPGKRMLSSMSPTIVLDSAGGVLLLVGGRGGSRIITSTAQVILDVVDRHQTLPVAMAAPRIHHQALPDTLRYEVTAVSEAGLDSLRAMGHRVAPGGASGTCVGILRVAGGGYEGVVDPRTSGGAVGY
jgi:gamma-glutamyltranspeptidase/glutathione hydrolase